MSSQIAVVYTRVRLGLQAVIVAVEAHVSNGLPGLNIVGLPDNIVKESKDRVRSALLNCNYIIPVKRIIINLAPADLPKASSHFDLPIAIAILAASGQIPKTKLSRYDFVGELSLSGKLHAIKDAFLFAYHLHKEKRNIVIPSANRNDILNIAPIGVWSADSLVDVVEHLRNSKPLLGCGTTDNIGNLSPKKPSIVFVPKYLSQALLIAAVGRHHILLSGASGSIKRNIAHSLLQILPEPDMDEKFEVAALHSFLESCSDKLTIDRPIREPHHTISQQTMHIGSKFCPGEVSLAHQGVLLLNDICSFKPEVLLYLLKPIEEKMVAAYQYGKNITFPAKFILFGAMLPCPCGQRGTNGMACICSTDKIKRYYMKFNVQLLERIDLHIYLPTAEENVKEKIYLEKIRNKIKKIWVLQYQRQGKLNGDLTSDELEEYCILEQEAEAVLHRAINKYNFTPSIKHRVLVVSRTIADINNSDTVSKEHLLQAIYYRPRSLEQLRDKKCPSNA